MKLSSLSPGNQRILRLIDEVGFGRLVNIQVIDSEAHLGNESRKHASVNLDKSPRKSPMLFSRDYELNAHQERFIQELKQRKNCCILEIGIHDGRPAHLVFDEEVVKE